MTSMMQDVVQRGTAARARSLNRRDLAGKTGTTNDYVDAWFAGYCQNLVAVTWVGLTSLFLLAMVKPAPALPCPSG